MTKLKNPLLSLGAHGSVGDKITFVQRAGGTVAEKKPRLPYFLTLPVQYQRWLYSDYVYLWHAQSEATKATYRVAGARQHLTAFQYWMKYQLTYLPDIIAYYKLDALTGATTPDSSRNGNNCTIYGASPTEGIIDGALLFDGVNDYLHAPFSTSMETTDISIECFVNLPLFTDSQYVLLGRSDAVWELAVTGTGWNNKIDVRLGGVAHYANDTFALSNYGKDTHIAFTFNLADTALIQYVNGIQVYAKLDTAASIPASALDLFIGVRDAPLFWLKGMLDHIIIWNRTLDQPTILRHSERRWPLK